VNAGVAVGLPVATVMGTAVKAARGFSVLWYEPLVCDRLAV
jgi:hypothetical protein